MRARLSTSYAQTNHRHRVVRRMNNDMASTFGWCRVAIGNRSTTHVITEAYSSQFASANLPRESMPFYSCRILCTVELLYSIIRTYARTKIPRHIVGSNLVSIVSAQAQMVVRRLYVPKHLMK